MQLVSWCRFENGPFGLWKILHDSTNPDPFRTVWFSFLATEVKWIRICLKNTCLKVVRSTASPCINWSYPWSYQQTVCNDLIGSRKIHSDCITKHSWNPKHCDAINNQQSIVLEITSMRITELSRCGPLKWTHLRSELCVHFIWTIRFWGDVFPFAQSSSLTFNLVQSMVEIWCVVGAQSVLVEG